MTATPLTVLTVHEVAKRLRVSADTVYRRIKDGELGAFKLGDHSLRVPEDEVTAYLRRSATRDEMSVAKDSSREEPRPEPVRARGRCRRQRRSPGRAAAGLARHRPMNNLVATPRGLPGLIGFGPSPPGFAQTTRFTGAEVAGSVPVLPVHAATSGMSPVRCAMSCGSVAVCWTSLTSPVLRTGGRSLAPLP
jgi:excisionase family DNA binding protein